MKDTISCTRCGHMQAAPLELHNEWDEIVCIECGEFLDTVGHWADAKGPSYLVKTLNQSRILSLGMRCQSRPSSHYPFSSKVTA